MVIAQPVTHKVSFKHQECVFVERETFCDNTVTD